MFSLRWIGDAEHYVVGYPATDIEVEDLDDALRLAETGLYKIKEGKAKKDLSPVAPADAAAEE